MRRVSVRAVSAALCAFAGPAGTGRAAYSTPGKVKVNIRTEDDTDCDFEAPVGISLMEAIRDVAGLSMAGACDGAAQCSTCHVFVSEKWYKKLPPAAVKETDLLDQVKEAQDTSRLACQITLKEDLDGIEVALPKSVTNLLF